MPVKDISSVLDRARPVRDGAVGGTTAAIPESVAALSATVTSISLTVTPPGPVHVKV
jgi:hypothetical protein